MRILKFPLSIAIAILLLASCTSKNPDELIIGKWSFVKIEMDKLKAYVEGESDALSMAMVKSTYESMKFEFYNDKTYEQTANTIIGTAKVSGKYEFINDGKYLVLNPENARTVNQEKLEILTLNADTLKYITNEIIELTFKRGNK